MASGATPILPYTINLVLDYISPPSQLDHPLPSQLISRSLLQRHHFIRPEDPHDYLCWPSPNRQKTIALLESLHVDHDQCITYPVRYFSDDQIYAHVAATSELRIVFQWDPLGGWKYHDANLMPFPPGCTESPESALLKSVPNRLVVTSHDPRPGDQSPGFTLQSQGDEGAYWDAYGQEDDIEETGLPRSARGEAQDDSEDGYWAQYATVQGSGDSTLPSPLQPTRPKAQVVAPDVEPEEPIVEIPYASLCPHPLSNLDPVSPTALTAALTAISRSPFYPTDITPWSGSDLEESSGTTSANPISPIPPRDRVTIPSLRISHVEDKAAEISWEDNREDEEALKESIRGLYRLWAAKRRNRMDALSIGVAETCLEDKETFRRIVEEVVQTS